MFAFKSSTEMHQQSTCSICLYQWRSNFHRALVIELQLIVSYCLSQGNLCHGHQIGQPLLDYHAIDILFVRDGECVGTRTKDNLNTVYFCQLLENSRLPTSKIRDVMSEPVMAGMNSNWENVMPENFFHAIDVIHFKTVISFGLVWSEIYVITLYLCIVKE